MTRFPTARLAGFVVAAAVMVWATAAAQVPPPAARPVQFAGEYRVARWTSAEGLPQNTVTDILQLPNGELWVATFGGLARFDGLGFRVIDMAADEELPSNRVVALSSAGQDAFWFLSQQGHLGRVEKGQAITRLPPPIPGLDTLDLAVDSSGRAFCRPFDGSVWIEGDAGRWRPVMNASPRVAGLRQLAATDDGEVWAIHGDRLIRVADEGTVRGSVKAWAPYHYVFQRRGGGLWVALDSGLGELTGGRIERLTVRPPVEGRVTAITQADERTMWVASRSGVSRLVREPDGAWSRVSPPLGLAEGLAIRSMLLDSRGSLWLGTNGDGLYRINRPEARRYGAESGFAAALALASDGAGGAFVTRQCAGVVHVDASGGVAKIPLRDASTDWGVGDDVCAISLGGSREVIWARAASYLFQIRTRDGAVRGIAADIPDETGPVVAGPEGSAWVVSRTGTVQHVAADGRVARQLPLPPPLMSASLGPDGALWVGGDGEVFRVGEAAVGRFGPSEGVPRGLVRDILAERDGTVWIGSYGGGVGRLRNGRVARLTAAHGLSDNAVSRILDDGRGRMWLLTNRGLVVVGKDELDAAADGRLRTLAPVLLGPERGVMEANFGSPAGFVGADGRLWFGTIEGIGVIDAAAFPFNQSPPTVRIEGVWADGRLLPMGDEIRMAPTATRVHLGFATFELLHPENVRFRFRVEGLDADWVDLGSQRFVDWTAPGPGTYRVLVEARNGDGVWSETPAAVVFSVLPAWWQTVAAKGLGALAVLAMGFAAYRLRVRSIERRHAARVRELEEQRQSAERVAALRAQLEHVSRVALAGELAASLAHEVSQPIGAIVNNAEAGRRNLDKYIGQPGQLAAVFDDIVADGMRASDVVSGLRRYLKPRDAPSASVDLSSVVREALPLVSRELRDHRIALELSLQDGLPPVSAGRVQLGQIVLNLVMNAYEALAGVGGERRIAVATSARGGRVELSVRDNGPGMAESIAARAFEPFVTTKHDGLGMGLAICRGIAEAHGGRLTAIPVPGGGLEMRLSLPAAAQEAPSQ